MRLHSLLLAALLPALTLSAQQPASPAKPAAPTGPDKPRSITLDVTVAHKDGTLATGLKASDFTLLDNKSPRDFTNFKAVSAAQGPVEVIIILDTMNVPYTTVSYVRKQLQNYLTATPHLPYPTTVGMLTDTGTKMATGFTNDGKAIADVVAGLPQGLRTFQADSGFYADQQRMQTGITAAGQMLGYASTLPGRKVVIWISPGWPLLGASDTKIDERMQNVTFNNVVGFASQLRQTRTSFYVINPLGSDEATSSTFAYKSYVKGLDRPDNAKAGDLGLQVFSTQVGGLIYTGRTDIIPQLLQAFDDVASWYELTFTVPPAEHPNTYHTLQIKMSQPDLTARTLAGYYAQP